MSYDSFLQLRRELSEQGRKLIDLSMVNPDLPPPRIMLDKLVEATLNQKNHRYTVSRGVKKLREAFSTKYENAFNVSLDPETEVCVTFGTKDAISQLFHVATNVNDTVLIPSPKYPAYTNAAERFSLKVETFSVSNSEEQMLIEIQTALKKYNPKILVLNFPNNPTGITVSLEFYRSLTSIIKGYDTIVYNDFVYGEMMHSEKKPASLLAAGKQINFVETYRLSKAYSVPGWRVGAIVGDKTIVRKISEIKADLDYGIFLPLQRAASSALISESNLVSQALNQYRSRCTLMIDYLKDADWKILPPEAGAFVWAEMPDQLSGTTSAIFAKDLLQNHCIAITPGESFGSRYSKFVRLAAVAEEGTLLSALDGIKRLQNNLTNTLQAMAVLIIAIFAPLTSNAEQDCIRASRLVREGAQSDSAKTNQEALYKEAISLCQQMPEAHHNLAVIFYDQGKNDLAYESIKKAIEYKEDPSFYITLGNIELKKGSFENATSAYESALSLAPKNIKALQGLAVVLEKKGDINKSLEKLEEASSIDGNDLITQLNLGTLYQKKGERDKAIETYNKALAINSNSEIANLRLGQLLQSNNQFSQSKIYLQKAFELNNNNPETTSALAVTLQQLEDFEPAEAAARKTLELTPEDANMRLNLASILIQKAEYQNAIAELKQVLDSDPNNAKALTLLGFAELESGNNLEAEGYLTKAVSIDASLASAYYNLGIVEQRLGKASDSKNSFRIAEELKKAKSQ